MADSKVVVGVTGAAVLAAAAAIALIPGKTQVPTQSPQPAPVAIVAKHVLSGQSAHAALKCAVVGCVADVVEIDGGRLVLKPDGMGGFSAGDEALSILPLDGGAALY